MEEKINGSSSKIRKRRNSSSSSSSIAQEYRFKRAILVARRAGGGSTTPVPSWIMASTQKSPTLALTYSETSEPGAAQGGGIKAKEVSVSARKLAATLWDINKVSSFRVEKDLEEYLADKKGLRSRGRASKLTNLSDPSHCPITERMNLSKGNGLHRRKTSGVNKQIHLAEYDLGGLDSVNDVNLMEILDRIKGKKNTDNKVVIKTCLKDVSKGLSTCKELLKVLNRIWGFDEQNSSGLSLVSALRMELDRARIQVQQLIRDEPSNGDNIEHLVRHFQEEKAAWRKKERERIHSAIQHIAEELEVEKKLRKQTERLNKKLGKELTDTKESFSKVVQELESEKRAKHILEQVCDELATGIGDDRAEVEELKRESAKVREEVEKEREMLQLADVLREERVQMKLSEAKYHFEEKTAAVERLKNELETYLMKKRDKDNGDGSPDYKRIEELEAYLKEIRFGSGQKAKSRENGIALLNGELRDGDDSADSDLHSIELNMDNNSRSYQWSYACEGNAPNWVSLEKNIKGRKSISENIQWESISLQRKKSGSIDGTVLNSASKNKESADSSAKERLPENGSQGKIEAHEDEIEKYKSVNGLRDRILHCSERPSIRNVVSPIRQWGQYSSLQEPCTASANFLMMLKGEDLKHRAVGGEGKYQISTSSRH